MVDSLLDDLGETSSVYIRKFRLWFIDEHIFCFMLLIWFSFVCFALFNNNFTFDNISQIDISRIETRKYLKNDVILIVEEMDII